MFEIRNSPRMPQVSSCSDGLSAGERAMVVDKLEFLPLDVLIFSCLSVFFLRRPLAQLLLLFVVVVFVFCLCV